MASATLITGLDIGTTTTRCVVCEVVPGKPEPKVLGIGSAPTQGLHHGYIINRSEATKSVQAAIREASKEAKIPIKNVSLAMGGISLSSETIVTTISVENPERMVGEADIARAIEASEDILLTRLNNRRILHTTALKFKLDGEPVLGNPIGLHGNKLSVATLFVTCLEHHFDELVSVVHDAGVNVIDVVPAPIAASCPTLDHTHKMAGSALVDIGAETVSIAVFENDNLISLEVFPIGSTDITNDIALGFQIPLEDAEQVKLGSLPSNNPQKFSRSKLDEIIEARLTDIFELLEKHLEKIKRNHLLPAGIVIIGGGSHLDSMYDFARNYLKLPIRIATGNSIHTGKRKLRDASWYGSYGLCCLAGTQSAPRYRGPSPLSQLVKQTKKSLGKTFKNLMP